MQACLERGDLDEFARLLHYSWQEKRRLAPGLSTNFIDEGYTLALEGGASAGKITGAGGGGFLLIYCQEQAQEGGTRALEDRGLEPMNFRFDRSGKSAVSQLSELNPN